MRRSSSVHRAECMRSCTRVASVLLAAATAVVALVAPGCASPQEEPSGSSSLALAQTDFTKELAAVSAKYDRCVQGKRCKRVPGVAVGSANGSDVTPKSLAPRGFSLFSSVDVCDVLGALGGVEHAYFFVGGSVSGGAVVAGTAGVDVVWDLWNQQAATFGYLGGGVSSLVGAEASAYSGYGFGDKSSVIDAWSGTFITGSLSGGLPVLKLSVGASGFASPDGSLIGGAVSVTVGFDFIPTPVDGSLTAGKWTPFDGGTKALGNHFVFVSYTTGQADYGGKSYDYLQLGGSSDLALSILETTGVVGVTPAAQAVALGILRSRGLTISQLCGDRKASASSQADLSRYFREEDERARRLSDGTWCNDGALGSVQKPSEPCFGWVANPRQHKWNGWDCNRTERVWECPATADEGGGADAQQIPFDTAGAYRPKAPATPTPTPAGSCGDLDRDACERSTTCEWVVEAELEYCGAR